MAGYKIGHVTWKEEEMKLSQEIWDETQGRCDGIITFSALSEWYGQSLQLEAIVDAARGLEDNLQFIAEEARDNANYVLERASWNLLSALATLDNES